VTNRLLGWNYDEMGNLLSVPSTIGPFTYDVENRQVSGALNGETVSYVYDGDGRRVQKVSSVSGTTTYVYDAQGQLAQEYGGPASTAGTEYLSVDSLGSTRLVTDGNANVLRRMDYLPFGQEILAGTGARTTAMGYNSGATVGSSDVTTAKFTGKERDSETGLDFFGARYFSSAQGRFTSADVPFAGQQVEDPQSWNMYAYGRNNPLLYTDPTGRNYTVCDSGGKDCADLSDSQYSGYLKANKGSIYQTAGGTLYAANQDGSATKVGSAAYYNEKDTQAAQLIVNRAGPVVDALGAGLKAFGYAVAAPAMAVADCLSGNCSKTGLAMAILPEVGALYKGGTVLKLAAAAGKKGAEILEKAGGVAQAAQDFEALQGTEQTLGNGRVKTLSDGTKAILRGSGDGRPTVELQHAAGGVTKIRYN
jgi:hypothetical protein